VRSHEWLNVGGDGGGRGGGGGGGDDGSSVEVNPPMTSSGTWGMSR